jgi:hypothetical protein
VDAAESGGRVEARGRSHVAVGKRTVPAWRPSCRRPEGGFLPDVAVGAHDAGWAAGRGPPTPRIFFVHRFDVLARKPIQEIMGPAVPL